MLTCLLLYSNSPSLATIVNKKYGKEVLSESVRPESSCSFDSEAVVNILIAIKGDKTELPPMRSQDDVLASLNRSAEDAQVAECLLSAEKCRGHRSSDPIRCPERIFLRIIQASFLYQGLRGLLIRYY
jgi:hypothetical protein